MHVLITGKQIDVGEALRSHVEDRLSSGVAKYFDRAIEAHVVFSRQGPMFRADCSTHVGSGITVQSHGEADEIYASFDIAVDRIEKRLRRQKRRLRDHHKVAPAEALPAESAVPGGEGGEAEVQVDGDQPVIVADTQPEIDRLTVGEAASRLQSADVPALMFRNRAHGGLNVVYRRPDGNVGWIDPQGLDRKT